MLHLQNLQINSYVMSEFINDYRDDVKTCKAHSITLDSAMDSSTSREVHDSA